MSQSELVTLDNIYDEYMTKTAKLDKRKFANYVRTYYGKGYKYSEIQVFLNEKSKKPGTDSAGEPEKSKKKSPKTKENITNIVTNMKEGTNPSSVSKTDESPTTGLTPTSPTTPATPPRMHKRSKTTSSLFTTQRLSSPKFGHMRTSSVSSLTSNSTSNEDDNVPEWIKSRKLKSRKKFDKYKIEINFFICLQSKENENDDDDDDENDDDENSKNEKKNRNGSGVVGGENVNSSNDSNSSNSGDEEKEKEKESDNSDIETDIESDSEGENNKQVEIDSNGKGSFYLNIDSKKMKSYTIFNLKRDIIKNGYIKNAHDVNLDIMFREESLSKMNKLVLDYWKEKKSNMISFEARLLENQNTKKAKKQVHQQWF